METSLRSPGVPARLGWVSFFNDCSSEVLARVLPLYLTASLGVTPTFIGVVEGLAESASIFLKGISGWVSDRLASRKGFVMGGYGLSVAARAGYLLSISPIFLGCSRILDRVGKGLRSAPRDAMVADAATAGTAGREFGLTRFLDTLGAMTGIAVVLALGVGRREMSAAVFKACAWIAMPLGVMALVILAAWVPRIPRRIHVPKRLAWRIPKELRGYLAIVFLFSLANSSDAFLVLKAKTAGFNFRETLVLFLAFNGLAASLAIPIGRLSDRLGRVRFLALGWGIYALAYTFMGLAQNKWSFAVALLGYGAFYGLTEGVEKAMVSDLAKPEQRGAGYGAFQMTTGLAALLASPLMGLLMATMGSQTAFLATGFLAAVALVALLMWSTTARQAKT